MYAGGGISRTDSFAGGAFGARVQYSRHWGAGTHYTKYLHPAWRSHASAHFSSDATVPIELSALLHSTFACSSSYLWRRNGEFMHAELLYTQIACSSSDSYPGSIVSSHIKKFLTSAQPCLAQKVEVGAEIVPGASISKSSVAMLVGRVTTEGVPPSTEIERVRAALTTVSSYLRRWNASSCTLNFCAHTHLAP